MIFRLIGVVCMAIYLPSLVMTQHSGNYWLQIIENYSVGIPLLVVALVEVISVSNVYGIQRYFSHYGFLRGIHFYNKSFLELRLWR